MTIFKEPLTSPFRMEESRAIQLLDGLLAYAQSDKSLLNSLRMVGLDLSQMAKSSETVDKLYRFVAEQSLKLISCPCKERIDAALGTPLESGDRSQKLTLLTWAASFDKKKFIYLCCEPSKLNSVIQALVKSVQWSQEQQFVDTPSISPQVRQLLMLF